VKDVPKSCAVSALMTDVQLMWWVVEEYHQQHHWKQQQHVGVDF
jgi:hypothetical protein